MRVNPFMTEAPIETSPLISSANQWTVFYKITTSIKKGFRKAYMLIQNPVEHGVS